MIVLTDLRAYAFILSVESFGEETDTLLEVIERFVEEGWALGSWYNCVTKTGEPWGLGLTILAGSVMTVSNITNTIAHYEYWSEHADDEDYKPPTGANSINGSLF